MGPSGRRERPRAVETREKIETTRSINTFLFVLWVVGVVSVLIAAATNSGT